MNQNFIKVLTAGLVGFGFYIGIPLVEYQSQCNALQGLHEVLIRQVDPRMGFTDGEARRTEAQATANAHSGIGIANSLHRIGLARDKFLTIDGKVTFDSKDYLKAGVLWEQLGVGFGIPTVWGGRWKTVDAVHYSCKWNGVS